MKTKKPHKLIFIGITTIVISVSIVCLFLVYNSSKTKLLDNRLKSGNREVREIGKLLETQLKSGLTEEKVIDNLQQSIVNMDVGVGFICMYDTLGVELCHPNPAFIGKKIYEGDSYVRNLENKNTMSFLEILKSGKMDNGIRNFSTITDRDSEIINVYPVVGTNWMVASHVNIPALQNDLSGLYYKLIVIFLISTILIIFSSYFLMRILYKKYEFVIDKELNELNEEVSLLNALNHQLVESQNKVQVQNQNTIESENAKERIIAYQKDQVVSIKTDEVAYIYLKNGLTFLKTLLGDEYPISGSLDDMMKQLDNSVFYRVNRQFIISISTIKTIYIYGKNQLKLITDPQSDEMILISKNKVAEFKKWLDR